MREILCNLPPLAEQKRIVEKIEEIFAKIDAGVEKLKSAEEKIKQYKQSVLHSAFITKLSQLNQKKYTLEDIAEITSSKRIYKNEYINNGIPFYRTKEIKELANNLPIEVELYISEETYNNYKDKYGVPKCGDLLISAVGTIGEIYVVKNSDKFYFKDGNILWFKNYKLDISVQYLQYFLKYNVYNLKMLTQGAAYNALTIEELKKFTIYLPSFSEQEKIVEEIEKRFTKADKMLDAVEKSLQLSEQLKQSVLKKAFEGKLVPQDPNDEPASVLLDRIKSEKQQNEKAKGKKK